MSLFKCFGGTGVQTKTVRQLHPKTWKEFVTETLGHPIILNVTRDEYAKMDKKQRSAVKNVSYVTPACFKTNPADRTYENADTFCLVALDIDVEADGSTPAKPFTDNPQVLSQQLLGLQFAAYTTASSTPEAPRLRVFAAADNLPVKDYPAAVHTLAQMLGLPTVTKESLVCVQPMFLPTMFKDDDAEKFHPLIGNGLEGDVIRSTDLTDTTTPTAAGGKAQPISYNVEGDELDYLRPAVEGVELEDVRSALEKLDPDMTYPQWLEIAASLRHQFPNEPEATSAYELFDEWSARGEKYVDSDDTFAKWKSLRVTPKGRAPVTIRTVLHLAQEAGWESTRLSAKCYGSTIKWILDAARTSTELMGEGIKRIAATPLLSTLETSSLLNILQDALTAKGTKVGRPDLKKALNALERAKNKAETVKATPDNQLPSWCRGLCYVISADEFFHRATNRTFKPRAFDSTYNAFLMEPDSPNGKPAITAQDYALNIAKIPRVDNYRYDPANSDKAFVFEDKLKFVNTYHATYPEPNESDSAEAGEIFMEHVATLVDEPEYQSLLIDWLAFQVQNPGAKIRWAVLLQGAEGCGKTAIAEALLAVMGRSNATVLDANLLLRDMFNGWAMGSQLVGVEEIRVVGHNRHEVMNRLKPCITNDRLSIRVPFRPPFQTHNNVNYIMFTNFHDSLAVSENDRRYFVLESAIQSKAQVRHLGKTYFARLYRMIKTQAGGLRHWLLNWKVSDAFHPDGPPPATKYLAELTKAGASPLTSAVNDVIGDKNHPLIAEDLISSKALKLALDLQNLPKFTDQTLASVLRELDYINLGRFRIEGERLYLWTKRGTHVANPEALARERMKITGTADSEGNPTGFTELL